MKSWTKLQGQLTFLSDSYIHLGLEDISPHPPGEAWRFLRYSVGVIIMSVSGGQMHILMPLGILFRWFRFLWQHFMSHIISPVKNYFIILFFFFCSRKKCSFFWAHKEINTSLYLPQLRKFGYDTSSWWNTHFAFENMDAAKGTEAAFDRASQARFPLLSTQEG